MRYKNQHDKPLSFGGGRTVEPGATFDGDEAAAAGVNVEALLRAKTVAPVQKPATRKTRKKGG